MHYCLNSQELKRFLGLKLSGIPITENDLRETIEYAESWQDELGVHNYLVCLLLCAMGDDQDAGAHIIDGLYRLSAEMRIYIQELEIGFLQYLLTHLRSGSAMSLEDQLVELHRGWREYDYDSSLRY